MSWQYERSMTPRQYEFAIRKLGMTQVGAGRFLGVSERTSRRFVAGHAEIPTAIVLLLSSMIAHNEQPVVPIRRPRQY